MTSSTSATGKRCLRRLLVRRSRRSGSVAPATCGFAPTKLAPLPPRPMDAAQSPEYRSALPVGFALQYWVLMLRVFHGGRIRWMET
jgi:hypothetical protein